MKSIFKFTSLDVMVNLKILIKIHLKNSLYFNFFVFLFCMIDNIYHLLNKKCNDIQISIDKITFETIHAAVLKALDELKDALSGK